MKNKSIYYLLALGVGMIGVQTKAEAEETTTYASKHNAPVFYGTKKATIHTNDFFSTKDAKFRVFARDYEDGDINHVEVVSNNVDTSKPGTYKVEYKVTDSDGNVSTFTTEVEVVDKKSAKNTEEAHEDTIVRKMYNNTSTWNTQLQGIYRGDNQDRQMVGVLLKPNQKIKAKVLKGPNMRVSVVTNDSWKDGDTKTINSTDYTEITTDNPGEDHDKKSDPDVTAVPFTYTPMNSKQEGNTKKDIEVEYKIPSDVKSVMYYHQGDNQEEFFKEWKERKDDKDYAVIDGDALTVLVPSMDKDKLVNHWHKHFDTLDEFLTYYDKVRDNYDGMLGTSLYAKSLLHQKTDTKYFVRANAHGAGGAYYGSDHVGVNNQHVASFFEPNWGGLHELGHGYQGGMRGNSSFELGEVSNNIFGYFTQHDPNIYKYTDYFVDCARDEKKYNDQRILHNQEFNQYAVDTRLYALVNLLSSFEEPKEVYAYMNYWYREMLDHGKQIDTRDVWIRAIAEKYHINVIPYFIAWGLPIREETKEYIDNLDDIHNGFILGDMNLTEAQVKTISPLTYRMVTQKDLNKINAQGNVKVTFDDETYRLIEGKTILIKDGSTIVKRVKVTNKTMDIEVPVGTYQLLLPTMENYRFATPYFLVKQNENTKLTPKYEEVAHQVVLPADELKIVGKNYNTDGFVAKTNPKTGKVDIKLGTSDLGNLNSDDSRKGQVASSVTFLDGRTKDVKKKYEVKFGKDQYYCYIKDENGENVPTSQSIDINIGDKMVVHHFLPDKVHFYSGYDGKENTKNNLNGKTDATYVMTDEGWRLESRSEEDFQQDNYDRYAPLIKEKLDAAMHNTPAEKLENRFALTQQKNLWLEMYQHLNEEDRKPYTEFIQKIKEGGKPVIEWKKAPKEGEPYVLSESEAKKINWFDLFTATDAEDGTMTLDKTNTTIKESNKRWSQPQQYELTITVEDSDHNQSSKDFMVKVVPDKDFADENVKEYQEKINALDFLTKEEKDAAIAALEKAGTTKDLEEVFTKANAENEDKANKEREKQKAELEKCTNLNEQECQAVEEALNKATTKEAMTTIIQKAKEEDEKRKGNYASSLQERIENLADLSKEEKAELYDVLHKVDSKEKAEAIVTKAEQEVNARVAKRAEQAKEEISVFGFLPKENQAQFQQKIEEAQTQQEIEAIVNEAKVEHETKKAEEQTQVIEEIKNSDLKEEDKQQWIEKVESTESKEDLMEVKEEMNKIEEGTEGGTEGDIEEGTEEGTVDQWQEEKAQLIKELSSYSFFTTAEKAQIKTAINQSKSVEEIQHIRETLQKTEAQRLEKGKEMLSASIQKEDALDEHLKSTFLAQVKEARTKEDLENVQKAVEEVLKDKEDQLRPMKEELLSLMKCYSFFTADEKAQIKTAINQSKSVEEIQHIRETLQKTEAQRLEKGKEMLSALIQKEDALDEHLKSTFLAQVKEAHTKEDLENIQNAVGKVVMDKENQLRPMKEEILSWVDGNSFLTPSEKSTIKAKVQALQSQETLAHFAIQLQKETTQKRAEFVKQSQDEVQKLEFLSSTDQAHYVQLIENAPDKRMMESIVSQAKEMNRYYEAKVFSEKQKALKARVQHSTFTKEEKDSWLQKIVDAKYLAELDWLEEQLNTQLQNQPLKAEKEALKKELASYTLTTEQQKTLLDKVEKAQSQVDLDAIRQEAKVYHKENTKPEFHAEVRYVSFKKSNTILWNDIYLEKERDTAENHLAQVFKTKGYYMIQGQKYYSVYNEKNRWMGYVKASELEVFTVPYKLKDEKTFTVTIAKSNQPIWKELSLQTKKGVTKKGKRYTVKRTYYHFNGKTYYSLYNTKTSKWVGYVDSKATKKVK